jgi:hypothetical protein
MPGRMAFLVALFSCALTLHAQMSVDEAMERLQERQAEEAAATTQPVATQPS